MDHLLRRGYLASALHLARDSSIQVLCRPSSCAVPRASSTAAWAPIEDSGCPTKAACNIRGNIRGGRPQLRSVHLRSQAQELVDAHIFEEAQKVLDALRAHDCGPALAWCGQHAGKLRKIRSHSLEFKLRLQVHPGHALLSPTMAVEMHNQQTCR